VVGGCHRKCKPSLTWVSRTSHLQEQALCAAPLGGSAAHACPCVRAHYRTPALGLRVHKEAPHALRMHAVLLCLVRHVAVLHTDPGARAVAPSNSHLMPTALNYRHSQLPCPEHACSFAPAIAAHAMCAQQGQTAAQVHTAPSMPPHHPQPPLVHAHRWTAAARPSHPPCVPGAPPTISWTSPSSCLSALA